MSSTSHFPNSPTARRANGERKAGVTDHGGAPQHGVAQEASDGQTHDRMVHHPTTQLLRLMFVLLWRCRTITFQIQFCSLKKMAIIVLKKITKINYIHTWGLTLVTVSECAVLRWLCFLIVWTLKAFLVLQVLEQSGHWWQKPLICVSTCSFTVYLQVKKKLIYIFAIIITIYIILNIILMPMFFIALSCSLKCIIFTPQLTTVVALSTLPNCFAKHRVIRGHH